MDFVDLSRRPSVGFEVVPYKETDFHGCKRLMLDFPGSRYIRALHRARRDGSCKASAKSVKIGFVVMDHGSRHGKINPSLSLSLR